MALTLSLPATTSLHLFGWSPPQPQRGHRVRPEYCEDLPTSWARPAKLAQLAGRIPTEHDFPSEHDLPTIRARGGVRGCVRGEGKFCPFFHPSPKIFWCLQHLPQAAVSRYLALRRSLTIIARAHSQA